MDLQKKVIMRSVPAEVINQTLLPRPSNDSFPLASGLVKKGTKELRFPMTSSDTSAERTTYTVHSSLVVIGFYFETKSYEINLNFRIEWCLRKIAHDV